MTDETLLVYIHQLIICLSLVVICFTEQLILRCLLTQNVTANLKKPLLNKGDFDELLGVSNFQNPSLRETLLNPPSKVSPTSRPIKSLILICHSGHDSKMLAWIPKENWDQRWRDLRYKPFKIAHALSAYLGLSSAVVTGQIRMLCVYTAPQMTHRERERARERNWRRSNLKNGVE